MDSPATPQVIATTGRGSLSLRPRNALSEEYAVRTESGILAIYLSVEEENEVEGEEEDESDKIRESESFMPA